MTWTVLSHNAFLPEFEALAVDVQDCLLTMAKLLVIIGPSLGLPHAETMAGSHCVNIKVPLALMTIAALLLAIMTPCLKP
jgi:hypothetical protein